MTTVLHRPTDCSHGSLSHWWTFFASVHDRFNKAKLIQSTISRDLVARTKYQVIGILMIFEVLSLFLKNRGTFNDFVKRAYLVPLNDQDKPWAPRKVCHPGDKNVCQWTKGTKEKYHLASR